MKKNLRRQFVLIFLLSLLQLNMGWIEAQSRYTPYDDLPTLIKNYKPAYNSAYPDWAQMLYQYPINFNELNNAYAAYMAQHKGEKSPIIRYYKLWRRAVSPYVLNDGTIQLPEMDELITSMHEVQLKASQTLKSTAASNADWTFLGPKETFWLNESGSETAPSACPWQVNIYSMDVAASNTNILYCGTETGFVNKSTDKGMTWQLLGKDYPFGGGVTAVAIHPNNSDIVYVAAGKQIHKTLDGGSTWTPLLPTNNLFYADRLKINPDDPQILASASGDGVFLSVDNGTSWTKKWSDAAYDVEFKPDDSNSISAIVRRSSGKYGIIHSSNGGASFSYDTEFPTTITEGSGGLLAMTPANPNIMYAVMLSSMNDGTPYLYKGTLSDGTWAWSLAATGKTDALEMNNGQGYFDLVLEISPTDEHLIFVGTTTLFKSTNGAISFNVIGGYWGDFSIHPDVQDMKMLSSGETWLATDGGLNFTTDNFTSTANYHARINGLIGSDMWGFDQGWNEDIVVGGRYHNGNTAIADFYKDKALRMGGAESPTGWILQGKSRHAAFDDLGNGWILPKTAEGKPEGRFVFSKFPNMDEYGGRRSNLLHHPNYYDILYLGNGNGFWRSSDGGTSFELLYTFSDHVRYLQISYSNPDVIYADVVNYGLYRSADGGKTWTKKPSLTNGTYGTSYWKGKLFFAISPYNENVIYACLQNGTWTADIGKVFRSADGGNTWENWTGSVSEYTKNIVIQPTAQGKDLVYLFTTSKNGENAKVYWRNEEASEWTDFSTNYPSGLSVNLALPFFRDSKIRVGGSGGVWETPLQESSFTPIVNPWCQKPSFNCMLDTVYFDDHSILNHEGAEWDWSFSPTPQYISDVNARNPKVVFGAEGSYEVRLSVTKNGQTYVKTVPEMVTLTTCPSIDDCSNPAQLPKDKWSLLYVDSEEAYDNSLASMAFDDDPSTIWHTEWAYETPNYPHEIQIDMGEKYEVHSFTYLPRSNGENGRIKDYELYLSNDDTNWGSPVKSGSFENSAAPQTINFSNPLRAQCFKLVAISEVNGQAWSSAAEFTMTGCINNTTSINEFYSSDISAYPVPTDGKVNLSILSDHSYCKMEYTLTTISGQLVGKGRLEGNSNELSIDLSSYFSGVYIIHLNDEGGITYRAKVIKR